MNLPKDDSPALHAASTSGRASLIPALDVERVRELVSTIRRSANLGAHTGHWDSTGRWGAGCPVCIEQRDAAEALQELAALVAVEAPPEVPDECHCPGYPCEHVPPPVVRTVDRVGYLLAYTRPVTLAMAHELRKSGLWAVADLAEKYAEDRPRWWHRWIGVRR